MNVLITGCAGFIGSHLADRLVAGGHYVWGVDNCVTGNTSNYPHDGDRPEARFKFLSISSQPLLLHYAEEAKPDLVIHCAASYKDPGAWHVDAMTNVVGTVEAVRVAQRHECPLIYFQTSLCYGNSDTGVAWNTNDALNPQSSYAISKTAGEWYIRNSGIDFVSFRLANIYGPRNLSGPIPTFYKKLLNGDKCVIADTRRDFVYIDDLVQLVMQSIEDKGPYGIFHVSTGSDYDIYELYMEIRTAMDLTTYTPAPDTVERGKDDVRTIMLDNWQTVQKYHWLPSTGLNEGIEKAVDWYDTHGVEDTYTHLAMKG